MHIEDLPLLVMLREPAHEIPHLAVFLLLAFNAQLFLGPVDRSLRLRVESDRPKENSLFMVAKQVESAFSGEGDANAGIRPIANDVPQAIDVLAALLLYVSKNSLKRGAIRMDV
jgi:hypothetical protein